MVLGIGRHRFEGRREIRHPVPPGFNLVGELFPRSILAEGSIGESSTIAVPASSAASFYNVKLMGEDRVRINRPITTPACRAEMVQPPWTAAKERPWRAASVNADRTRESPRPARDLGRDYQPDGRFREQPRAARPPASKIAPEAARIRSDSIPLPILDPTGQLPAAPSPPEPLRSGQQPALDQHQDDQEERRRDRGGDRARPGLPADAGGCPRPAGPGPGSSTHGFPDHDVLEAARRRRSPPAPGPGRSTAGNELGQKATEPGPIAAPIAPAPTQVAIARRSSPKVETINSSAATTATAPPMARTARPVRAARGRSPAQTRLPPAKTARPTGGRAAGTEPAGHVGGRHGEQGQDEVEDD